jgi:hypothetical protein
MGRNWNFKLTHYRLNKYISDYTKCVPQTAACRKTGKASSGGATLQNMD